MKNEPIKKHFKTHFVIKVNFFDKTQASLVDSDALNRAATQACWELGIEPRDAMAANLAWFDDKPFNEEHLFAFDVAEAAVDRFLRERVVLYPRDPKPGFVLDVVGGAL